jgi:hypothetical protein
LTTRNKPEISSIIEQTGEIMKFADLLKKKAKEGKYLSDDDKRAKKGVVDEIDEMMGNAMGENLKKVTVAADSKEGLEAGLEKAKEVIAKKADAEDAECEMCDEEGYEHEMDAEPSKDDRIAQLKAELAELEV